MSYIRINTDELNRACEDLAVKVPLVQLETRNRNSKALGNYNSFGIITLFLDTERAEGSARHISADLNRTFLHELRHHWQFTHRPETFDDKPGAYWTTECERDARQWADQNVSKYRIVRLAPRTGRSPLSRLSTAERNVRS